MYIESNIKHVEFPLNTFFVDGTTTHLDFTINPNKNTRELSMSLVARLIKDIQHSDTIELSVKVPLNWWQHIKHDLAPVWLKNKWPVKYIVTTQTFKYDLELISLPKYEVIKNLSAHTPIIRGVVRERSTPTDYISENSRTKM